MAYFLLSNHKQDKGRNFWWPKSYFKQITSGDFMDHFLQQGWEKLRFCVILLGEYGGSGKIYDISPTFYYILW